MKLKDIFLYCEYIANKEQRSGSFSIDEFNRILPLSSLSVYKQKYGLPEEYQINAPFSRQTYELTQKISDDLSPFKVWMGRSGTIPLSVSSNGEAIIPNNYFHVSSIRYKRLQNVDCDTEEKFSEVEILTDAQFSSRLGKEITAPTYKNPVCTFYDGFIQFAPKNLQFVDFVYLRKPVTPYLDYYLDTVTDSYIFVDENILNLGTGVLSLTTELDWAEDVHQDIINNLLSRIGINIRENQLLQYAEMLKAKGV
jgi:hypothetical protein